MRLSSLLVLMGAVVLVAAVAHSVGFAEGMAARHEHMPCSAGPGEISHLDERGFCAVTRKGRVVTRYQT